MNYFITGIDTDSGKTLVSAIFCQAMGAAYWKPVQSGLPRDTDTVSSLVTHEHFNACPETYVFKTPASPHAASRIENVTIELERFVMPVGHKHLIIEGAGGCLVPLNDNELMIDLMKKFSIPVVLVADLYLGSINHTLLSFEALSRRNIAIAGIVFNGETNPESERIILKHTALPCLLRISKESEITPAIVDKYAQRLKSALL